MSALTLDALDRLISFDTVSARSNLGLVDYLATFLRDRQFRVTQITDPSGQKAGLYAEIGPAGDGVALSAHTDVVPTEGQDWTVPAFQLTRRGTRLYGRGTTDMKGFVAAMLYAADRAAKSAAANRLKEPLKLVFSYDEEIGCVGIQHMQAQLPPLLGQPRACFVGEPTQMQVAIGHKGKAALRAVCHGQPGHSALATNFVNALHLAAGFVTGLQEIQATLRQKGARDPAYDIPYSTVHAGILTGGRALNIVPDRAEVTLEYRHLAADPAQAIHQQIQAMADAVAAAYQPHWPDARIELEQYNAYPGLDVGAGAAVTGLAQRLAQSNTTTKVPFGTEAGVFANLGIPTVVCGPGSMAGQGHKPDEYLELAQLQACERMMDRIIEDLS
jgi:acetylornithine deacetylase